MPRSLALILFLASLLCPNSAHAAPTYTAKGCKAVSVSNVTSLQCTITGVLENEFIAIHIHSQGNRTFTVHDSFGLPWTLGKCQNFSGSSKAQGSKCWYYAYVGTHSGDDLITVSWSSAAGFDNIAAYDFCGMNPTPGELDDSLAAQITASGTFTDGILTSTADLDLFLMFSQCDFCSTQTLGAGWTAMSPGFDDTGGITGYAVVSPAGTLTMETSGGAFSDKHDFVGLALKSNSSSGICGGPPPPPTSTGMFIRGVWFLDGSAGSTGGGGGGGTGGGGTEDLMDWVVMDARRTDHLTPGYSAHYLFGDTIATATAGTNFAWIKNSGGNPWDINHFDNRNISFWITENGEQAPTNASAYKRFIAPVPIAPRYFTPGSTVTITTDGANPIIRTTNCEADHQAAININHIKGVTTGPASTAWGGDVGTADTITVNYYWGGTGSTYNTREREFLVKGFGRVGWDTAHWNGSSYVIDDATTHNTLALGASPDPNFTCGYTSDWWQLVNGTVGTNPNPLSITSTSPLPNATQDSTYQVKLQASGGVPPYTWDSIAGTIPTGLALATDGTLSGTPSGTGTSSFTAQATDSVAATASKSLSITVNAAAHYVALAWSASGGASSYNIYRSTVNGACSPAIASGCSKIGTGITQLSFNDGNVTSGKIYFYVATAVNSGGESGPSNQVAITIP